jgi:hypothetical protein
MTQDATIEELFVALKDEYYSERDAHKKGVIAIQLVSYMNGDKSKARRQMMAKLLAYRRRQA